MLGEKDKKGKPLWSKNDQDDEGSSLEQTGRQKGNDKRYANALALALVLVLVGAVFYAKIPQKVFASTTAASGPDSVTSSVSDFLDDIFLALNDALKGILDFALPESVMAWVSSNSSVDSQSPNQVWIASWNLNGLDLQKANDQALMDYYRRKMTKYDIVVVQEITDETGEAFRRLCRGMEGYQCILSATRGSLERRQQYGILYRKARLTGVRDWWLDSLNESFERPPYSAEFSAGSIKFRLTTINTRSQDATSEIHALESLLDDGYSGKQMVLGTLNAGCRFYDLPPKDFQQWDWIITDGQDTTVSPSDCPLDRIIVDSSLGKSLINSSIMTDVSPTHSGHYLVAAAFARK